MIATIINCITVIIGTAIGVLFHSRIKENFKGIVFTGIGIISLLIGIKMSLVTTKILAAAFSLVLGGLTGYALKIEDAMLSLGDKLGRRFNGKEGAETGGGVPAGAGTGDGILGGVPAGAGTGDGILGGVPAGAGTGVGISEFANGFLTATVLFCVGAMTIVGSLKAGLYKDYELILTKSVMDGFMAIMMSASMGIGVGFSVIIILIYQGGLTLLAGVIEPLLSPLALSELEGVGGMLIVMIGLNLLQLKSIKTANFIPALFYALLFAVLNPYVQPILERIGM